MSERTRFAITLGLLTACAEVLTACAEEFVVDTSSTIALRLEGTWSEDERHAAANAATAWNLEFGTRVRLAEFGDNLGNKDGVPIWFTDEACKNGRNQATHARATTDPPAIRVCPATANDLPLLFETLRHELGHILGIPVHATDTYAVMTGRATNLVHWFRDEDRDLFFGANGEFVGETGCAVSPRIADGSPMLAHPADQAVHLIWAKDSIIRFAPLSRNGVLGAEAGHIITEVAAHRLDAYPTADGFLVTWFEENRINFNTIALPDARLSETQVAQLEWPVSSFYRVSEQHAPPYYWLALTINEDTNLGRTLHLLELDESRGTIISSLAFPMAHGELVTHEGQTFLVTAELDTVLGQHHVHLHRIEARPDGFDLTESVEVASVPYLITEGAAEPEPILTAQSTSGGIVILLQTSPGLAELVRMKTQGQLAVDASIPLHAGRLFEPAIIESHGRIFIAATMLFDTHYQNELYLLQLAPDTLDVIAPWQPLSSLDTVAAQESRIAIAADNLIAVWKEPSGDVRSRCLRLVP